MSIVIVQGEMRLKRDAHIWKYSYIIKKEMSWQRWPECDLEDRAAENTKSEQKSKKNKKYKDSLSDLWENIKHINIHIIE